MLSVVVFFGLAAALLVVLHYTTELNSGLGVFLIATYVSRIALHLVTQSIKFFDHGIGGDARIYEFIAKWIANQWALHGITYMTATDNLVIGATSLPPNIFAGVIYLNGGEPAPVGCTAVVAFGTCLAALNFFKLAIELGAERRPATLMTMVLFTLPGLVFYTADMYKDGLVLMFVLGAVGSAIRLSRRFTVGHLVLGLVCLFALWFVRYYMVFLAVLPIVVGYMGFGSKGWTRPVLSVIVFAVLFVFFVQSEAGKEVGTAMDDTFTLATSQPKDGGQGNAYGGSAVRLGHGIGTVPIRLVYTIFSPFPWQGGTVGLHLGKIDTLIFTYLIYRAVLAAKKLARTDRATLLSLAAFIVPTTFAYAMTFANIGLTLRQRIPIVTMVGLLAVLSWPTRHDLAAAAKLAASRRARALRGQSPSAPDRRPSPGRILAASVAKK